MAAKPARKAARGIGARLAARYAADPVPEPVPPPARGAVDHRSSRIRSQMARAKPFAPVASSPAHGPTASQRRSGSHSTPLGRGRATGRLVIGLVAAAAGIALVAWPGLATRCWNTVLIAAQTCQTPQDAPFCDLPYITTRPMIAGVAPSHANLANRAAQKPDRIVLGATSNDGEHASGDSGELRHR